MIKILMGLLLTSATLIKAFSEQPSYENFNDIATKGPSFVSSGELANVPNAENSSDAIAVAPSEKKANDAVDHSKSPASVNSSNVDDVKFIDLTSADSNEADQAPNQEKVKDLVANNSRLASVDSSTLVAGADDNDHNIDLTFADSNAIAQALDSVETLNVTSADSNTVDQALDNINNLASLVDSASVDSIEFADLFNDEDFSYLIAEDFNDIAIEDHFNLSNEDFNSLNKKIAIQNEASSKWEEFKNKTLQTQATLPGWCSRGKAEKLMDMVATIKPAVWVEIGVFGGSSLYPVAEAMKHLDCGVCYAVDSWTREACAKGYEKENPNAVWWTALNLQDFYDQFCSLIKKSKLNKHCTIIKKTSFGALKEFENNSVSVLYIDGNHSELQSTFDVICWLPKVQSGGYIWFNAANWPTAQKAVRFLYRNCEIDEYFTVSESCLCFRKP